jgi:hypothetical protein
MILPVLIAPRGIRLHQFRFMRQLHGRSVDNEHGALQSFPALLHLRSQLVDYALTHLAGYQFRQFLPRLAITTRGTGDLVLSPSLAAADQIPGATVEEVLDRRRQTSIPVQPLPDHQPNHHREAVDPSPEIVTILVT